MERRFWILQIFRISLCSLRSLELWTYWIFETLFRFTLVYYIYVLYKILEYFVQIFVPISEHHFITPLVCESSRCLRSFYASHNYILILILLLIDTHSIFCRLKILISQIQIAFIRSFFLNLATTESLLIFLYHNWRLRDDRWN